MIVRPPDKAKNPKVFALPASSGGATSLFCDDSIGEFLRGQLRPQLEIDLRKGADELQPADEANCIDSSAPRPLGMPLRCGLDRRHWASRWLQDESLRS